MWVRWWEWRKAGDEGKGEGGGGGGGESGDEGEGVGERAEVRSRRGASSTLLMRCVRSAAAALALLAASSLSRWTSAVMRLR